MRVALAGGGPAGLYLALLLKRQHPGYSVSVVERNPADATFGFGVVFSQRALGFLRVADESSYAEIQAPADLARPGHRAPRPGGAHRWAELLWHRSARAAPDPPAPLPRAWRAGPVRSTPDRRSPARRCRPDRRS